MYRQYKGPLDTLSTHTKPKTENRDKRQAETDNSTGIVRGTGRVEGRRGLEKNSGGRGIRKGRLMEKKKNEDER